MPKPTVPALILAHVAQFGGDKRQECAESLAKIVSAVLRDVAERVRKPVKRRCVAR